MLAKGRAMEVTMSFALLCHPRVPSHPRGAPWLHPIKHHSPPDSAVTESPVQRCQS